MKATINALEQLCDKTAIADMRGLPVEKLRSEKESGDEWLEGKIKIKLVRSPICTPQKHKDIVRSLGLA